MIDGVSIIDFNVRLPLAGYQQTMMYTNPARTRRRIEGVGFIAAAAVLNDVSVVAAEHELEAAGVDGIVLPSRLGSSRFGAAAHDELISYANAHQGGAWVLMAIDPTSDNWRSTIEQACTASSAVRGIIIEPGILDTPRYADDEACSALYEYCQAKNILVALASGGNSEPDCGYSLPIYFDRVARDYPKLKLLIVHGGWPWVLPAIHVAQRHENIYLMPDAYILLPGAEPYHAAMSGHLKHRFVYGSAYPFMPPGALIKRLRKLLDDAAAEYFFSANAKKLLQI